MRGLAERLTRPILAALALALVELLLVVFGPAGPALMVGEAVLPDYAMSSLSLLALSCLAIWALGSIVARTTGSFGLTVEDDSRSEQMTGIVAGIAVGLISAWAAWPELGRRMTQNPTARWASAILVMAVVALVIFALVTGVAWRARRKRATMAWSFFFFTVGVAVLVVAAMWLRDAPSRTRSVLSLVAMGCACLAAISMPGRPGAFWVVTSMAILLATIPGLSSTSRVVQSPNALHWVQTYAPATGGILLAGDDARRLPAQPLTLADEPANP